MLPKNIFRPPLDDAFKIENQLAILASWKGTTETNTHNFSFENKLNRDDYGTITMEIP